MSAKWYFHADAAGCVAASIRTIISIVICEIGVQEKAINIQVPKIYIILFEQGTPKRAWGRTVCLYTCLYIPIVFLHNSKTNGCILYFECREFVYCPSSICIISLFKKIQAPILFFFIRNDRRFQDII